MSSLPLRSYVVPISYLKAEEGLRNLGVESALRKRLLHLCNRKRTVHGVVTQIRMAIVVEGDQLEQKIALRVIELFVGGSYSNVRGFYVTITQPQPSQAVLPFPV